MDIREVILAEHSKEQCDKIVKYVGKNQRRFDILVDIFLHDEYRAVQRAAWPLSICVSLHPHLADKHLSDIAHNLEKPGLHNAVKRNTVRLFQYVSIPETLHGLVMNRCFEYVADPKEAVAVKAFSLTILQHLAKQYPEIIPEIKLLIAEQLPTQTAAFRSRAKQALSAFDN